MIEVELKGYANDNVFEIVRKRFEFMRRERHEDTYFGHPCRDFVSTDEALRIRITRFNGHFEAFLTYKGPKLDERSKTREEIEVSLDDPEGYSKILEKLGFFRVARVVKTREIYFVRKGVTIALDDVEGLGKFVEAEALTEDPSEIKNTVDMLISLLKNLGIEKLERRSYLELLLSNRL